MTNPRGYAAELRTYHYMMEPGDATRYRFSITFPDIDGGVAWFRTELHRPANKITDAEDGYVLLAIQMPSWQGIYPTSIAALDNLDGGHVHYLAGRMGAAGKSTWIYTIAAVCLAASVLVHDPLAVEPACHKMLLAPSLLHV